MRKKRLFFMAFALTLAAGCGSCNEDRVPNIENTFEDPTVEAADLPWREWGAAAFQESKDSGKPVFLSLTSELCRNCPAFDSKTLSNDRVRDLIQNKFIPVRVQADRNPAVARRYAGKLPSVAVITPQGDLTLRAGFLSPSDLNKRLFSALRNETPVLLAATAPRAQPAPGEPGLQLLRGLRLHFFDAFDNEHARYGDDQTGLRLDDWTFDYLVGHLGGNDKLARTRLGQYANAIWSFLHDEVDGGFLSGTYSKGWTHVVPIKRAVEQAEMAALIGLMMQPPFLSDRFKEEPKVYVKGAEKAVNYLLDRLVVDNRVYPGTIAGVEYYAADAVRADSPRRVRLSDTVTAARTAAALTLAGIRLEKPEWVERAAAIAGQAMTDSGVNPSLEESTALSTAALNLYEATAKQKWLDEASRQLQFADRNRDELGYYIDVTEPAGTPLPGEAVPYLNAELANAAWRLGALTGNERLLKSAWRTAELYGASPLLFEDRQGLYGVLLWRVNNRPLRLDIPRDWASQEDVSRLVREPDPRKVVAWTDDAAGRVCIGDDCEAARSASELYERYRSSIAAE